MIEWRGMDSETPHPRPVDTRAFRLALGRFVTGITVITTLAKDGRPVGLTVNSFNSVSLDPPLVLWSIDRRGSFYDAFAGCARFAVNVLCADQRDLSRRFAGIPDERFEGVDIEPGQGGIPLLKGCIAWFECRTRHRYDGGDHLILVGEVDRFEHHPGQELLYFAGQYGVAAPL